MNCLQFGRSTLCAMFFLLRLEKQLLGLFFYTWIMMCQLPWRSRWVGWFTSSWDTCSNIASLSSLCYLFMLLSLFPSSVILSNFSAFSTFFILSNFFHLLSTYFLRYLYILQEMYLLSTPQKTTLSPVVSSAQEAFLAIAKFWCGGIEAWLGGFHLELSETLHTSTSEEWGASHSWRCWRLGDFHMKAFVVFQSGGMYFSWVLVTNNRWVGAFIPRDFHCECYPLLPLSTNTPSIWCSFRAIVPF